MNMADSTSTLELVHSANDAPSAQIAHAHAVVQKFKSLYLAMNVDTISEASLRDVYAEDIRFMDPFHSISGLPDLTEYFRGLYENVGYVHFDFTEQLVLPEKAMLTWQMTYNHPKLNRGKAIRVEGCTHLGMATRIYHHRDYFDAGQMLYEQIPLLRSAVGHLKKRMSS